MYKILLKQIETANNNKNENKLAQKKFKAHQAEEAAKHSTPLPMKDLSIMQSTAESTGSGQQTYDFS